MKTTDFSISLPRSNKPILQIQQYQTPNLQNIILFISTIDAHAYLIQITPQTHIILEHFKLSAPSNALFYDALSEDCIIGDVDGCVHRYPKTNSRYKQKMTYSHPEKIRPEFICVYKRSKSIYAWNLNSQIIIIDQKTMKQKNRIKLDIDITCCQVLKCLKQTDNSACVSFANNKPPFIFDCDTGSSIVNSYKFSNKFYEQTFQQQITMIAESKIIHQNHYISTGSRNFKEKKSYICVYQVQKLQKCKIFEIRFRLEMQQMPVYISIFEKFLQICMWQCIKVINIEARKQVCKINNMRHRWGIVLYLENSQYREVYRLLISKGFNMWDIYNSSYKMNQLHYQQKVKIDENFISLSQDATLSNDTTLIN